MEFNTRHLLFVGIIICGLIVESTGHSYVTEPESRSNQKQTESGCRGPACLGPCDAPLSSMRGVAGTYKRGDQINVQWPRNNHAGGFIRFAWSLTSQSDLHASFDTHVQQINCHEVGGCGPSDPSNPNGGDNGAADGSYLPCQTSITVPGDLADGAWTLQWAWFGGAFALGDYYSCMDLTISGGSSAALVPVFVGGDYSYPNQQKCKFFNTDRLHVCVNEPCVSTLYPNSAQESGPPAYIQKNADGSLILVNASTSPAPAPVVTPTPAPVVTPTPALTTAAVPVPVLPPVILPITTASVGRVSTSTSAKASTSSSTSSAAAKTSTSSTSSKPATPSSSTSTSGSAPSSSCSAGQMKCLTSETFSMCAFEAWGPSMSCAPGTTCQPFGNVIQCGWPINS